MGRIRGRGNRSTEDKLAGLLRTHRIKGWRRHQNLPGKPDFVFRQQKVAVFVDGCFWHGCPRHSNSPATNREFWQRKIAGNRARDRRVGRLLREKGWKVVRIWEHELTKGGERAVRRLCRALGE